MIDNFTCTVSTYEPTYCFNIVLNDRELDRLRHDYFLGLAFKKNKYVFLNDLAEILAARILDALEKLEEK